MRGAYPLALAFLLAGCSSLGGSIDAFVHSEMTSRHIPGLAFVVVDEHSVVDARSYGAANLELGAPVSSDTVFAIGSISKSFTAIATMMTIEAGRLGLDDSVASYVTNAPEAWRPVTIRHLLSNTSGIPDNVDRPCEVSTPEPYTMTDAAAEVSCLPLLFHPGDRFSYSNSNFLLLSIVLEKVTGMPLQEAFATMIFSPLGMHSTRMANYAMLIPNRADGYLWGPQQYQNVEEMDPAVEAGAGGILSTSSDMARFVLALRDSRLLTQESWDRLWTAFPVRVGATPYALGFGITPYEGRARIGHNGAAPGYASSFAWFPDEKVGVVLLSNGYEEPHGRSLMDVANKIAAYYFKPKGG